MCTSCLCALCHHQHHQSINIHVKCTCLQYNKQKVSFLQWGAVQMSVPLEYTSDILVFKIIVVLVFI